MYLSCREATTVEGIFEIKMMPLIETIVAPAISHTR